MKLKAKILDGRVVFSSTNLAMNTLFPLEGQDVEVEIKRITKKRTNQQNKSLHLYFKLLADELNNAGLDMKKTLKNDYEIPWNPDLVKTHLWKTIQKAYLKKKKTKDLKSNEIDKVYEVLNKALGEKFGLYVPFPSIDILINEERN